MSNLQTKNCPVCFVEYAAPQALFDKKQKDGGHWFCPNGHNIIFTKTEADKMRDEHDRIKQQLAQKDDEIASLRREWNAAENRAAEAVTQTNRLKTRAHNGVCPCCNRTFVQLARHMKSKHPTFTGKGAH